MVTARTQGAWTRRGILRATAVGSLLSGYVGLSVALQPTRRLPQAGQGEPVLDNDEYSILSAVVDAATLRLEESRMRSEIVIARSSSACRV